MDADLITYWMTTEKPLRSDEIEALLRYAYGSESPDNFIYEAVFRVLKSLEQTKAI